MMHTVKIDMSIDGPFEASVNGRPVDLRTVLDAIAEDAGPRPDPSYLDQFTTAQLMAEVERRRREDAETWPSIYVVAGDYRQYREVYAPAIREALGGRCNLYHVSTADRLLGIARDSIIALVGTYYLRPDAGRTRDALLDRGMIDRVALMAESLPAHVDCFRIRVQDILRRDAEVR